MLQTGSVGRYRRILVGGGDPVLLTVSNIHEVKRIEWLIESAPLVLDSFPNAKFVVVGGVVNKKYYDRVLSMIENKGLEERFVFTGSIPFEEMPKAYNSADVLVHPSSGETFGTVIAEALASGLPVIVYGDSEYTAAGEVVGSAGERVRGSEEILPALERILEDYRRYVARSRKRSERFSWDESVCKMLEAYELMTANR